MDNKHELDELLKKHMEFKKEEQPELNPSIQTELRKKVRMRKKANSFLLINNLKSWMNINIKLYQASLAMLVVVVLFSVLRPTGGTSQNKGNTSTIADTSVSFNSNSIKQDSFLVRNFSVSIN